MNLSLIFTTVLKHFTEGPPVKSWDLKFHLAVAMIKNNDSIWDLPTEGLQNRSYEFKVPSNIIIKEVTLNERYRQKSKLHLEKGLKQYEDVLDDKWKEPKDMITGEWVYIKEDEEIKNNEMDKVVFHIHGGAYCIGSAKLSRALTSKYVELAKARVFSTNYRLAPQNQFPASLCDTIAAYLYLIDPEPDAGFKPINPKKIVIAGESAGGGLALATLLFLRDAGLPLPGGAILLSPWLDLTHSMPSFWDTEIITADLIRDTFNIRPSSSLADEFIADAKSLSDKIAQKKPAIVSHPSFIEVPRFQLYCTNEALAIPYISPLLAESLGNLPPILCQVGGFERLRDEAIFFSYKAAYPQEYQLPSYATKNFEKSPFKKPTKVILEVYNDMPHFWQMFQFSKSSQISLERCGEFIKRVTSIEDNNTSMIDLLKEDVVSPPISISPSFIGMRVGINGEIRELNETDQDCLKWDKIGIVPKETMRMKKL
ncbi:Alpha/Beta hydrolase protein [Gigaspora rosea]|uniref:Alpha/Beta hydrolase protein n=1 Tax=Gigaspora rosea TaxID=44941 RepID=A0A397VX55_9GLOM|nr:Alpha/Beta hydrolase protein [Gigaspora rosea]